MNLLCIDDSDLSGGLMKRLQLGKIYTARGWIIGPSPKGETDGYYVQGIVNAIGPMGRELAYAAYHFIELGNMPEKSKTREETV